MKIGKISEWSQHEQQINFRGIKLKPMQLAIINCNKRHHVLANLPTGFGKSMLFQYPASQLTHKTVIVFVPLKALLWDCLKEAQLLQISAAEVTPAFIRQFQKKQLLPQLLFLTPERLFMNNAVYSFIDMLSVEQRIELVVIDEAHCVSEWGSDFRPDYSKLCDIRDMFSNIRILGMSATMPAESRQDLVNRLKIPDSYYFQSSSNRPNLVYQVKSIEFKRVSQEILGYVQYKGLENHPGIIYCQTIKTAEKVYDSLKKANFDCCLFHSKLSEKTRSENFGIFMGGKVKAIVATICFGMGVNKKDIRYVINVGISLSAENYYQESGRAGRDGELAYCLLLAYKADQNPLQFLIKQSTKKSTLFKRRLYKLSQIKQYTNSTECRKKHLFALLGQEFTPQQCKKTCDFCQNGIIQEFTLIDYTQKALSFARQIAASKAIITKYQLIKVLRGNDSVLKNKTLQLKAKNLKGVLMSQTQDRIRLIIEALINLKLLSIRLKFGKYGKVEYVQAGPKKVFNQVKEVFVKVPALAKLKIQKDHIQTNKPAEQKFNNYLKIKNKSKTEPDRFPQFNDILQQSPQLSLKERVQRLKKIKAGQKPAFHPTNLQPHRFGDRLASQETKQHIQEDCQLQEIKMVTIANQYHNFLQDLFSDQNQLQISQQCDDLPSPYEERQSFQDDYLEVPMFEQPKKELEQVHEQQDSENSFWQQIRRQKTERQAKKLAVVRAKLPANNKDFL